MSTYKITNITNLTNKRDFKYNSPLEFQVVDNMVKQTISIKPADSVFLTVSSLPLSIHRLRVKGLITVVEVSPDDIPKKKVAAKPKAPKKPVEKKPTTTAKKTVPKKKTATKATKAKPAAAQDDSKE